MNNSFLIEDKYREFTLEINKVINDFNSKGELIKGTRNTIKKINIDNLVVNIKRFKSPNIFNKIAYTFFRSSKANRSYNYAKKLIDSGIMSPKPIGFYEFFKFGLIHQSYYVSENIAYDYDMEFVFKNIDLDFRDDIIKKFTYFTHNLHENGIMFLDHSRSNTLVKKHDDDYRFYLIDLNRMKFKSLSTEERFKNFRRLKLNDEILEKVSSFYSEIINIEKQIIFDKIKKYSDDFENGRKCRKRLKKFFRL